MYRRVLLGALLVFVGTAASADNFSLLCNRSRQTFSASQQRRYVLEPGIDAGRSEFCCASIVPAEALAHRLLLLESLRLPDEVCAAELAVAPQPGVVFFLYNQLYFSKAQLCWSPSAHYIWAANSVDMCFSKSEAPGSPGTARLLAFSTVEARSLCDSGAWLGTLPSLGERQAYVFAPNERLSNLLPSSAKCAQSQDYIRVVPMENATSSSLRALVLAAPKDDSCRSLFVQGRLARDGDSFAVPAGSRLTISYNRSHPQSCADKPPPVGAVIRLSFHEDADQSAAPCPVSRNALTISLCATAATLLLFIGVGERVRGAQ